MSEHRSRPDSFGGYDLMPLVVVPGATDRDCARGWAGISAQLKARLDALRLVRPVLVVDCYPGVDVAEVERQLSGRLASALVLRAEDALSVESAVNDLIEPYIGGSDPIFGRMCDLELAAFFDPAKLAEHQRSVATMKSGLILVVGCGASLIVRGDVTVYADLARWEIQGRQRRGEIANLGTGQRTLSPALKYKRAFFIDWRVCDRWKTPLIATCDFFLDTHHPTSPLIASGSVVRRACELPRSGRFALYPFSIPPLGAVVGWGRSSVSIVRRPITAGASIACRRRTVCCWAWAIGASNCRLWIWCSLNPSRCSEPTSFVASEPSFRSASTFSIPWAAEICRSRFIP